MNHQECYRLLEIEPGCDWDSLRKAYRRQVQRWHPDRYTHEPDQQARAAERLQKINLAFEELQAYYERHGRLPEPPKAEAPRSPPPPPPPPRDDIERAFEQIDDILTAAPPRHTLRRTLAVLSTVLAVLLIIYVFFTHSALFPRERHTAAPATRSMNVPVVKDTDPTAPDAPAPAPPAAAAKKVLSTFTYGATPGEVFAAQGIPTRTVGDIWYYGQSEVHFERGQVVSWHNTPMDPLNIQTGSKAPTPKGGMEKPKLEADKDKKSGHPW